MNDTTAIGDWKAGLGEWTSDCVVNGSAKCPWFKKKTKIDTKVKPMVIAKVKKPPTLLTAAILSTPLAAKKVTTTKNITSKISNNCVDDKLKKCQLCVVSWPEIAVDTETKKNWVDDTSQTTQAASQIKVPINAVFSLTDPLSQEKIPPLTPLKAAPYSAKINAEGKKNKIAVIMYQTILAYPIW